MCDIPTAEAARGDPARAGKLVRAGGSPWHPGQGSSGRRFLLPNHWVGGLAGGVGPPCSLQGQSRDRYRAALSPAMWSWRGDVSTRTQQATTGPSQTLRNGQEVEPWMGAQGPFLSGFAGLARDQCQVPHVLGEWVVGDWSSCPEPQARDFLLDGAGAVPSAALTLPTPAARVSTADQWL